MRLLRIILKRYEKNHLYYSSVLIHETRLIRYYVII
jgi:hypothetical protein